MNLNLGKSKLTAGIIATVSFLMLVSFAASVSAQDYDGPYPEDLVADFGEENFIMMPVQFKAEDPNDVGGYVENIQIRWRGTIHEDVDNYVILSPDLENRLASGPVDTNDEVWVNDIHYWIDDGQKENLIVALDVTDNEAYEEDTLQVEYTDYDDNEGNISKSTDYGTQSGVAYLGRAPDRPSIYKIWADGNEGCGLTKITIEFNNDVVHNRPSEDAFTVTSARDQTLEVVSTAAGGKWTLGGICDGPFQAGENQVVLELASNDLCIDGSAAPTLEYESGYPVEVIDNETGQVLEGEGQSNDYVESQTVEDNVDPVICYAEYLDEDTRDGTVDTVKFWFSENVQYETFNSAAWNIEIAGAIFTSDDEEPFTGVGDQDNDEILTFSLDSELVNENVTGSCTPPMISYEGTADNITDLAEFCEEDKSNHLVETVGRGPPGTEISDGAAPYLLDSWTIEDDASPEPYEISLQFTDDVWENDLKYGWAVAPDTLYTVTVGDEEYTVHSAAAEELVPCEEPSDNYVTLENIILTLESTFGTGDTPNVDYDVRDAEWNWTDDDANTTPWDNVSPFVTDVEFVDLTQEGEITQDDELNVYFSEPMSEENIDSVDNFADAFSIGGLDIVADNIESISWTNTWTLNVALDNDEFDTGDALTELPYALENISDVVGNDLRQRSDGNDALIYEGRAPVVFTQERFREIQPAENKADANPDTTIEVCANYDSRDSFPITVDDDSIWGEGLSIVSVEGPSETTVDAGASDTAFKIVSGLGVTSLDTVTIEGFEIKDYEKYGINGEETTRVYVANNVVYPVDEEWTSGTQNKNSIDVEGSCSVVDNNFVGAGDHPSDGTESSAIAANMDAATENIEIINNEVIAADIGIAVANFSSSGSVDNVLVENNTIDAQTGVAVGGNAKDTSVLRNEITGNETELMSIGVRVASYDYSTGLKPTGTEVHYNIIENAAEYPDFPEGDFDGPQGVASIVAFDGSTGVGTPLVAAANNYWGDDSGPSEIGEGAGLGVTENVTYKSWLVEPSGVGNWSFQYVLEEGTNLVSLPLIPEDNNIEYVLGRTENVDAVWAWSNYGKSWRAAYDPAAPVNDLETMVDGEGYWVNIKDVVANGKTVLAFNGSEAPETGADMRIYDVYEGWNLIGYKPEISTWMWPGTNTMAAENYLGTVATFTDRLYEAPNETDGWDVLDLENDLYPGYGYWLATSDDGAITP